MKVAIKKEWPTRGPTDNNFTVVAYRVCAIINILGQLGVNSVARKYFGIPGVTKKFLILSL